MTMVCTSGYFNPIHRGHIRLIRAAATLGDYLVVIVNNDIQVALKGGVPFQKQDERMEIVKNIKGVDQVVLSIDTDRTVRRTLEMVQPQIFAKGGDSTIENIPEKGICERHDIKVVFAVGGGKVQASSRLLGRARQWKNPIKY